MTPERASGRLAGKVALVTGAARGQGRSHAVRMAEEGADVIAIDICAQIASAKYEMPGREQLEETARMIEAAGGRVVARLADVRDSAQLTLAVNDGVEALGRLDTVAANAGISSIGLAHELTDEQWKDIIDVNLTGVWRTTKAAIPAMIECGNGGSISITSSLAGFKGFTNSAHYVSAKHALVGFVRSLAAEAAPYGIRVNSVHPTNVDTDMIMYQDFYDFFAPGDTPATVEQFEAICASMQLMPNLPWIDPVDVSNALVWLASDEARYITGVNLPIDGGAAVK